MLKPIGSHFAGVLAKAQPENAILQFVQSHGFEAVADGDAVTFLIPCTLNGQDCQFGAWERVSTIREARNALGY